MKKFVKVLTFSLLMMSVCLCAVSAKDKKRRGEGENVKELSLQDFKKCQKRKGGPENPECRRCEPCSLGDFSIGQVTEVKTDALSFKDADGNEKSVKLSPFTKIEKRAKKSDSEKKFEKVSVSDIKKDSWVIVSVFETDTKAKIASRILVEE